MAHLRLGNIDTASKSIDKKSFLQPFHSTLSLALRDKMKFRDDGNSKWRDFTVKEGSHVIEFQQFLKKAGFMPFRAEDGVFGYVTLAATRLFQEYIRSVEGDSSIGIPDGIVGANTLKHVARWKAADLVSEWGKSSEENASEEYKMWMSLLNRTKTHYVQNQSDVLKMVENYPISSDSLNLLGWSFLTDDVHLIGFRRSEEAKRASRINDDFFILLINGMVFKCWGSTDPNQAMGKRKDEPFLVEGQHKYKLGWHKVSSAIKTYKALRPYSSGVLVFRDVDNSNSLTETDVKAGLTGPNPLINIHWSGVGSTNFSAGCQVIAGKSYINHLDKVVDCSSFASISYDGLGHRKTRGAYDTLSDLVLVYSQKNYILYTLGKDDVLDLEPTLGKKFAEETLKRMK